MSEARYTQEQFNERVWALLRALMADDNVIDDELSLDALAFVAALIFDMHPDPYPSARVLRQTKKASEMHGTAVRTFLDWMQRHHQEKGIRFGETIGGEEHMSADLPPGHGWH